jgi:demethylmenaquinone methyltransferase/2-methoxy-6-polyprenyl-1,4-benzoquinol methylase
MIVDEYHATASFYNRWVSPLLKQMREDIRTFIYHRRYKRIIDICCGTGAQLQLLEGPDMELVGVDNSISMLEQARHNCSGDVQLHLLDAEQHCFTTGEFDCAIISFGLHEKHPASRKAIFDNTRKLLRQGGAYILADYSGTAAGLKGALAAGFLVPVIERCAGKVHFRHYLSWSKQGGLEGFLKRRNEAADIISRPFGGAITCCAITIDDEARTYSKQIALLNKTFAVQTLTRN